MSERLETSWSNRVLPPRVRSDTIERDRVTRLLDDAGRRPLTVVCAPAGYGKTTAVAHWLQSLDCEVAWLSLDPSDDDPRRLCAELVAAFDRVWPAAMIDAERVLTGGSDLELTFVPLVARTLAERTQDVRGTGLVIVLDDYHAIGHRRCHQVIARLIDAAPEAVRVVIATRTPPPLRLARRRALRTVAEVGVRELRFASSESERLLNDSLGLGLDRDQLAMVDRRVEGWAAGLALVASALPEHAAKPEADAIVQAFRRSRVGDYLIEEVFGHQAPEMQEFLCRTSILRRLNASLCEAVTGSSTAHRLLDEVRRSNLFVTELEDGHGEGAIRYHQLFAELLQRELVKRAPELTVELHLRASRWYERAGAIEDAIRHASAAGDGARAAGLLHAHWPAMLGDRRDVTVRRMIDALPEDRGPFGPFCQALALLCSITEGGDERLVTPRMESLVAQHPDAPGLRPVADVLLVSAFYGNVGRAAEIGREAWARYAHVPAMRDQLAAMYALALWCLGDYRAVHRLLEPRVGTERPPLLRIWAMVILALTLAAEDEAELAERYARQAVGLIEEIGGETAIEFMGAWTVLAEALRLGGKLVEARASLDRALAAEARRPGSVGHTFAVVADAQLALAEGDRRRARNAAGRARRMLASYEDMGVIPARVAAVEDALRDDQGLAGTRPTRAEQRVLALLSSELTYGEIADRLYLSVETVRSHVRRLYRRLDVHCREQAVRIARQRGLL